MITQRPNPVFRIRIIPVKLGESSASITVYGKDKEEKTAKQLMKNIISCLGGKHETI